MGGMIDEVVCLYAAIVSKSARLTATRSWTYHERPGRGGGKVPVVGVREGEARVPSLM